MKPFDTMTRDELIAELERHSESSSVPRDVDARSLHLALQLDIYREETRIQNEQLRESQLLLEESRDRYADLYESAPFPYLTLDASGIVVEINLTGAAFLGREREVIQGFPFLYFVHDPPNRRLWLEHLRRCRLERQRLVTELSLATALGPRVVQLHSWPREVRGQFAIRTALWDIADLKRSETDLERGSTELEQRVAQRSAELQTALERLRDAEQQRDEFLGVLGHELRNPLAGIANGLAVLEYTAGTDSPQQNVLHIMRRQLHNATRIIDDLLDVTRVAQGKVDLQRLPVNLQDALEGAMFSTRQLIEQKKQSVLFTPASEPLWTDGDPTRIEQIFVNLLHNAVKYTHNGGSIHVEVGHADGFAEIRIRDSGAGMTTEQLACAFDLFSRSRSTTENAHGGLGIGLKLVKELTELHGGSVAAHSDGRGQGCTFVVRLPLRDANLSAEGASSNVTEAERGRHRRILIIEDDRDTAQLLAELLKQWGYDVAVAHNGESGIAQALEACPEIVLLDIALPGMDGYSVARALRGNESVRDALLVAITGYCSLSDRRQAADAGIHYHLAKPVAATELRKVLQLRSR